MTVAPLRPPDAELDPAAVRRAWCTTLIVGSVVK